jgi:hypothetical protein
VDRKLSSITPHPERPITGDIFIARSSSGADRYDLGLVSGPPQLVVSGRQVATVLACELGRRKGVDVWCTDDYASYLLLVRHRVTLDPRLDIAH